MSSTSIMPQAVEELAAKERETLDVIREDVCQWLSGVLKTNITPANFLQNLDTGVLLCKLVKLIQEAFKVAKNAQVKIPPEIMKCNEKASKESFAARDNASNFISWCRNLGVEEAVMFESEGLVLHKDEKRVILCLLDVARFAERVGIPPPQLVRMEREIETLETASSKPQRKQNESEKTLKGRVMFKLKECTCVASESVSARDCGSGKFIITGGRIRGDKTIYIRLLSDRIMVRVGGGWDTLEHFLLEHDPCRVKKFISDGDFHGKVTVCSKNQPAHMPHNIIYQH